MVTIASSEYGIDPSSVLLGIVLDKYCSPLAPANNGGGIADVINGIRQTNIVELHTRLSHLLSSVFGRFFLKPILSLKTAMIFSPATFA